MGVKRSLIKQYDDVALKPEAMPQKAVKVTKNPKESRVKYLFFDEQGKQMCSAKCHDWTPEQPRYCGSTIIGENGRCKVHGGTIVPGPQNPSFKNGKYSRSLPTRLASHYAEAQQDPELQTLTNELMLLDSRLHDLLSQTTEGGSAHHTKQVMEAWKSFNAAARSGDSGKIQEQKYRLDDAIKALADENGVWMQVEKVVDLRRKLVLAEGKRMQMIGALVPVEKVNVMIGFIIALIGQQVHDRAVARRLIGDVLKLVGRDGDVSAIPGLGEQRQLSAGDFVEGETDDSGD